MKRKHQPENDNAVQLPKKTRSEEKGSFMAADVLSVVMQYLVAHEALGVCCLVSKEWNHVIMNHHHFDMTFRTHRGWESFIENERPYINRIESIDVKFRHPFSSRPDMSYITLMTHLRKISLYRFSVTKEDVSALREFKSLTSIKFRYCSIEDGSMKCLSENDGIRDLTIESCKAICHGPLVESTNSNDTHGKKDEIDLSGIEGMRQLRSLHLTDVGRYQNLSKLIKPLDQLTELDVSGDGSETMTEFNQCLSNKTSMISLSCSRGCSQDDGMNDETYRQMALMPGLTRLILTDARITPDKASSINQMKNLTHLEMFRHCADDDAVLSFGNMKALKRLVLRSVSHSMRDLSNIFQATSLEDVSILGTPFDSLSGISSLTNLKRLCINSQEIGQEDMKYIPALQSLTCINLCSVRTYNGWFQSISSLSLLKSLSLSCDWDDYPDSIEPHDGASIAHMNQLTDLTLQSFNISDGAMQHISTLPHVTNLDLKACTVYCIRPLANMTQLRRLEINQITTHRTWLTENIVHDADSTTTEDSSEEISDFSDDSSDDLSRILLNDATNPIYIADERMIQLGMEAMCSSLTNLVRLDISENRVNKEAIQRLPLFKNLRYLGLFNVPIDEEMATSIKKMKKLRFLHASSFDMKGKARELSDYFQLV